MAKLILQNDYFILDMILNIRHYTIDINLKITEYTFVIELYSARSVNILILFIGQRRLLVALLLKDIC